MDWHKNFVILMVDDEIRADNAQGEALRAIVDKLQEMGISVVQAVSMADARLIFQSRADIGCILLDWDAETKTGEGSTEDVTAFIEEIKEANSLVPVFLFTERLAVENIPLDVIRLVAGYFWETEDTAEFIAGHVEQALEDYLDNILPPFFRGLVEYTEQYKYTWHTPGHGGGVAFRKSPSGMAFHKFFGENTLRSDLSVSVPELGSLMEHSEVLGDAERNAAAAFGSDRTYFVTNGTSTANKMVFQGRLTPGDVVLVDRNCHKSALHSMILTRAVPVYLIPTRNEQGIIGPIHPEEFDPETIRRKLDDHPLVDAYPRPLRHAIVTNSTYDGLCYHVGQILDKISGSVDSIHFDEAWYAYACFHEMYDDRYGMFEHNFQPDHPVIFATQSTHKLLAAFSQASMVHVKDSHVSDPDRRIPHERFNEAFMMHTSTSPQYGIIASLDVATSMMQHGQGRRLIAQTIEEAVHFRRKLVSLGEDISRTAGDSAKAWWFSAWQPESAKGRSFHQVSDDVLCTDPDCWTLDPDDRWHGFEGLTDGYCMLDPVKVTVVTPGIDKAGAMTDMGIPAGLVSRFLRTRRIVVEKTQFYSFLILFSMGTTKGKSGTLLAELFEFKRLYDSNRPVTEIFPDLARDHAETYGDVGLRDIAESMHGFLKDNRVSEVIKEVFEDLPKPVMTPAEAYDRLVRGEVEEVRLDGLKNRVAAVMVVPYPPGIPVIMPGEVFPSKDTVILDYLKMCEEFDNRFPGFETEIHGVTPRVEDGRIRYYIYCVK